MADQAAAILVVDDQPANVKLLTDLLAARGYRMRAAHTGEEALAELSRAAPDLVLLDVIMPGMSGYDVCRRVRANPDWAMLPVVMITALDPRDERVKGLEAGADDFLSKPFNQAELLARVRSLLRIKTLYDTVAAQRRELVQWNAMLEQRVRAQVEEMARLAQLKRFFSPQLAERILAGGAADPLASHRREVVVVFIDLRGFTAFAETAEPDEVMRLLREYHADMGQLILHYEGTLERFAGDGMMVFFNDPVEVPDAALRAVRMALAMRDRVQGLSATWQQRGHNVHAGLGIAQGYATLGAIGFEGRIDYGAIGTVTNLAARLCAEARPGQILASQSVVAGLEGLLDCASIGELPLKGFARPTAAWQIVAMREAPPDKF